ncbi:MAG: UDP-N-acetylglucosamine-peptide N-acetylglucosaminyltransferase, partial [Alphaproteobacteria bacterium]
DHFLETPPNNAQATASDALWAGVPLVTSQGNTFPGRVAASVLHAIGLPELITESLEEYERLAMALAQNPQQLTRIKDTLRRNRDTAPLFDTARFTRDLESAYAAIWKRKQDGLPAASLFADQELARAQ